MLDDPLLDEAIQRRACAHRSQVVTAGTAILAMLMALVVLDGVGVVDLVGVDTGAARATSGATTLVVEHPQVTRPGLASPLTITVERAGGFDTETVDVAIDRRYLALWDFNAVIPAPREETADGESVIWTFAVPAGDVLTVQLDASIEPARQSSAGGRVAVLDPDGDEVVAVELTTQVRP